MNNQLENITELTKHWVEDFFPGIKWDDLSYMAQDVIYEAAKVLTREAQGRYRSLESRLRSTPDVSELE